MNQLKWIFAAALLFTCFFSISTSAQTDPAPIESNYEAILQVVLGSSEATQKGDLPPSLNDVSRQLKTNFSFPNYKLVNTYIGRLANTGNLEYKSLSNIYGLEQESDSPSFLDWRLVGLRSVSGAGGRKAFNVQHFRFGARVPIRFTNPADASGKAPTIVNYESLGLTLDKTSVPENSPTLIGTLSLPKTTGTVFLVLTVKPVDN